MPADPWEVLGALLVLLITGLICYAVFYLFFLPMNRVRDIYQVNC